MNPNFTINIPNSLLAVEIDDKFFSIFADKRPRRKFVYKMGRFAGKVKNFFKRTQTKIVSLISYWAFETVLFALIMLNLTTLSALAAATFLYLYGTYVIYAAVSALTK